MTRSGKNARIICTDAKNVYSVVALIAEDKSERVETYLKDGIYSEDRQSYDDLFFAPEKHEGWINLCKNEHGISWLSPYYFASKKEAEKEGKSYTCSVTTIKIEWEE